ncbi:MAG: RNA polymerase sigma factor [Bryobacteraceae bacterium]
MSTMAESLAAAGAARLPSDFSSWMLAEQGRIFRLCQRMLGDSDEAGSATQDVFLKAYQAWTRSAAELDDPSRWVTRIAVNTCLDRLRSRRWQFWRRRPDGNDEELILAMTPTLEPDGEAQVFGREIGERLRAALERLSPRQRAVFVLRHFDDCPLEEIAAQLGLDVGTVKAHLARAVAKLREELKELYGMSRGGRT